MAASGISGNPDPHNQSLVNSEVLGKSGPTPPGNQHLVPGSAKSIVASTGAIDSPDAQLSSEVAAELV